MLGSVSAFADGHISDPLVTIDGVDYRLVKQDDGSGEVFRSAVGYCKSAGYIGSEGDGSQNGIEGPYAVLDETGKVVKTYPKDDKYVYSLEVITDLYCAR